MTRRERLIEWIASWESCDSDKDMIQIAATDLGLHAMSEAELDAYYVRLVGKPYPRIGRPPALIGQDKGATLSIRLSGGEMLWLQEAATAAGISTSEWDRSKLREALELETK